ncbi:GrpB family protein [Cohnella sp. JJ-181]|uniref:GrpB family protein n=1 Tax=Cohnella rhizoplanae TaxID=2974897 RepID=UPI0022FFA292|nr:GrpB family protein [Cohnella sp. JJ-181]CAI6087548.1 Dephospho-CoA kinase [Cohnella sp. JJ-181]
MDDQWRISSYDPAWRSEFYAVGAVIRKALSSIALRIDHVGSTSVPGLAAKPIVDIQVSVLNRDDDASFVNQLISAGFVHRADNPDKTKRYFRETPGMRRVHVHVRESGSIGEQLTLLFRDYLRNDEESRTWYTAEKQRLLDLYYHDRAAYVEGKGPIVWDILQQAHRWAKEVNWRPGASDA